MGVGISNGLNWGIGDYLELLSNSNFSIITGRVRLGVCVMIYLLPRTNHVVSQ